MEESKLHNKILQSKLDETAMGFGLGVKSSQKE